jgi:O-antigen/teichoic acid export membrane protein
MSQKASIKKNLGFQTAYQVLITCLPLITSPYLSRVLGASQLGVYSFTSSIMSYFALFAMLGTSNHGTRSIASCGDDRQKRSETFWNIYLMQAGIAAICTVLYVLYVLAFATDNKLIAYVQTIHVMSCILNINWLFFGIENFKLTVVRNGVIKIASVILILLLVKKPDDLWLYVLIVVGSELLSQIVMWAYVPKFVGKADVSMSRIMANLKPSIMLFVPLLAMSIYHIMDKTMLGGMSTYTQSGYYYNADKVVNVTVGVISGISTVMLPRMSSLISAGKKKESDDLFRLSLEGTALAGIALAFGIAAIANEFEPIFFGPGYEECILLTIVLAPVLIIKSFSFTARYQYLIPHHREKSYTASVILGAAVNLVANYLLIPRLGAMGAVMGTLLAEFAACVWQFASIRKLISLKSTIIRCAVYFAFGLIMFFAVRATALIQVNVYLKVVLEVLAGVMVYLLTCEAYWRITHNDIRQIMFGSLLRRKR